MENSQDSHSTTHQSSNFLLQKAEAGSMPDMFARFGICKLLHDFANNDLSQGGSKYCDIAEFIDRYMRSSEDASTDGELSNMKHSELPAEFYELCMGDYLKNSCGYWPELEWHFVQEKQSTSLYKDVITGTSGMVRDFEKNKSIRQILTKAEVNMVRVSLARAEVRERQYILDLGCGWGSALFYALETYSHVKVVGVTNSQAQADYIKKKAQSKRVNDRLLVIVSNIKNFTAESFGKQVKDFLGKERFDRIYSIEAFEYIRNWERVLNRLQEEWLNDEGKIFIHFVAHKTTAYKHDNSTWIGQNFLKEKIVASHDLVKNLDQTIGKKLVIEAEYKVNGRHYSKTAEAWLKLLDQDKGRILKIFEQAYGKSTAKIWYNRWRVYFLMLAEMFGMREGTEWFASNYLLRNIKAKVPEKEEKKTEEIPKEK